MAEVLSPLRAMSHSHHLGSRILWSFSQWCNENLNGYDGYETIRPKCVSRSCCHLNVWIASYYGSNRKDILTAKQTQMHILIMNIYDRILFVLRWMITTFGLKCKILLLLSLLNVLFSFSVERVSPVGWVRRWTSGLLKGQLICFFLQWTNPSTIRPILTGFEFEK